MNKPEKWSEFWKTFDFNKLDLSTLDIKTRQKMFDFSLPYQWHPKCLYSTVKQTLAAKLFGANWYEILYPPIDHKQEDGRVASYIIAPIFKVFQQDKANQYLVKQNIMFWSLKQNPKIFSYRDWFKMFQATYDFDLPELYQQLWILFQKTIPLTEANLDIYALLQQIW